MMFIFFQKGVFMRFFTIFLVLSLFSLLSASEDRDLKTMIFGSTVGSFSQPQHIFVSESE